MRSPLIYRWLLLALVTLAAFWLRTHDLGRRPMHADEANQAVKLGELLETGRYAFDPHDHHGPTLYYAAVPIAWLRGETTLATLTETTLRLLPAIAGTLSVLLLAAFASPLARPVDHTAPARNSLSYAVPLAAAAFLAVAPAAVYYSRYFVQETLLATFTLGTLVCAQCWWQTGRISWVVATGVGYGLMQATKASAPLFALAALVAVWCVRPSRPASSRLLRDSGLALAAAVGVAVLFYSSFGTHGSGLRDAVAVYGFAADRAAGGSGHEKPWWYYLRLFAVQHEGGLVWNQLAFTALALCGAGLAFIRRAQSKLLLGAVVYTMVIAAVLSVTPYKTPWHAIHLVPGLALLAAGALGALPRQSISVLLAVVVIALQYSQTRLAVFLRPADARNPYAYVHSSADVLKFRPLVDAALASSPDGVVRVISEEYWPLPWYFRGLSNVGYWTVPPDVCDGAVVIASADYAETIRPRLHGHYRESYLGLRPGFVCVVFTAVP